MTKFEIAISTLFIGFILGQTVDFIKYRWEIHRKKKGILDEITDIEEELKVREKRIKIIIHELNSNDDDGVVTPSRIISVIYEKHYADVAPFFTRNERKAINSIYMCIAHFNNEISNGKRNNLTNANKSLISMYSQCKMGLGVIQFFHLYKGKIMLEDKQKELNEIQLSIQGLSDKYLI